VSTAAKVTERKRRRPDLYCPRCLWMTGGGACPRHGGPAWTEARAAEARRRSQDAAPVTVRDLSDDYPVATVLHCGECGARYSATKGDYFSVAPDRPMTCCGRNLRLVSPVTAFVGRSGAR
jgi:hypothetical protein